MVPSPPRRGRPATLALAVVAGASLLLLSGCMAWRLSTAKDLAEASEPYTQSPPDPVASLLVVGDSTGVGTGASSPRHSVAGLIGADHPKLHIDNLASDGATYADVADQLARAKPHDIVLVLAGGNDVIRLTDGEALRDAVQRVVEMASKLAPRVVVMPSGNVGNAPFFLPPLSWWMTHRSRELHEIVASAAARHGATYVDLYKDRERDPFVQRPGMHASDGLHPSDAGYRQWYDELGRQADLGRLLHAAAHVAVLRSVPPQPHCPT